ncbi:class I SAM-dependent methyltransferase [Bacteroidota bacterium]
MENQEAFQINQNSWNKRAEAHLHSSFYDTQGFLAGKNMLNPIELELLGPIQGQKLAHLQCHFGLDTLSLERFGASCTGIDFSEQAITQARDLAFQAGLKTEFRLHNVVELPTDLNGEFDIVFTSYGTIGWLPDLKPWAEGIARILKPGGRFVLVEFHPVVWMFDNDFTHIAYSYFNKETIVENESGSYADSNKDHAYQSISWNHALEEVFTALQNAGLRMNAFQEFDYSPYPCFNKVKETKPGQYQLEGLEGKIPMVYGCSWENK